MPGKILCIARSYRLHAQELNNPIPKEPVYFLKPASSLASEVQLRGHKVRYESELVLLIRNKQVHAAAVGLDLTRSKQQDALKSKGLPWEKAKAFQGSAICSEFIQCNNQLNLITFSMQLNGKQVQTGGVNDWLFPLDQLLNELDEVFRLDDNDIIFTGTPAGVGNLHSGDEIVLNLHIEENLQINFAVGVRE